MEIPEFGCHHDALVFFKEREIPTGYYLYSKPDESQEYWVFSPDRQFDFGDEFVPKIVDIIDEINDQREKFDPENLVEPFSFEFLLDTQFPIGGQDEFKKFLDMTSDEQAKFMAKKVAHAWVLWCAGKFNMEGICWPEEFHPIEY